MMRSGMAAAMLATVACAGTQARAETSGPGFVSVPIASRHIGGDRAYEEFNPGIGIGRHLSPPGQPMRVSVEAGAYRNSHGEISQFGLVSADWPLDAAGPFRAGLAVGLARYPGRGDGFRGRGVPAVGDWVPLAGATISARVFGDREVVIGAFPAPGIADVIVTFQFRHPF